MKRLFADLETYSATDLKSAGGFRYAEDCEVLLFGYAVDEEDASVWDLTAGGMMPDDLRTALGEVMRGERMSVWHNGLNFDTLVLSIALGLDIPVEQITDTRVIAYEHSLPGGLMELCTELGVAGDHAKDVRGERLVQIFSKPSPRNHRLPRRTALTHPDDWDAFIEYCRRDVEALREVYRRLPKWNVTAQERRLQALDARINRRGFAVDMALIDAAARLIPEVEAEVNQKIEALTGGALHSVKSPKLVSYMRERYGLAISDLRAATVKQLLQTPGLDPGAEAILQLRKAGSLSSVKKYLAVAASVSSDGRLRGTLQFRGANRTGRYSGRLAQFQNLPRPSMKADEVEFAVNAAKNGLLTVFFPDVLSALKDMLRGVVVAPEGKKLVVCDYSNIEGRVLAWAAGEEWKLKAYREGKDLYKIAYSLISGIPAEKVSKGQRQIGKVLELALGYGGGVNAFAVMAGAYGVDLSEVAKIVKREVSPLLWKEAEQSYTDYFEPEGIAKASGLEREVFIACDAVKRAWRQTNKDITDLWGRFDRALKLVLTPDSDGQASAGVIRFERRGSWLLVRLPSGRYLCYRKAKLRDKGFTYMGTQQMTGQWAEIESYAQKMVENAVQAIACDLLCESLIRLEEAGYQTVLTVHDEVIAEVPDTPEYSAERMAEIMCELPAWAKGLPLMAEGFEAKRYRK